MALNVPVFKTRLLSAMIFGAVMLLGLFGPTYIFLALFFLINILCLREYIFLIENILQTTFSKNEKLNFIAVGVSAFIFTLTLPIQNEQNEVIEFLSQYVFQAFGLLIGSLIMFSYFIKEKRAWYLLTGIPYIALALGLLMQLRFQSQTLPIALIFFIWTNDTMAYLTGSFIGKTPFFSSISPKKTWEGIIGGTFFTLIFAAVWGYFSAQFELWQWIGLAAIASVIGNAGDLVESKLKRLAGVKDSGAMMPGHGGALDRFDSLLLAAPFAYLFSILFELGKYT